MAHMAVQGLGCIRGVITENQMETMENPMETAVL